jgi:uncharacterized protein (DUF305 family)
VPFRRLGLLLLAAAAAASLTSCNSGDSPFAALGGARPAPNAADAAFLRSMTEHEQVTLGITRLAQRGALRKELRRIAHTMTTDQEGDLRALGRLAQGLPSRGVRPPTRSPSSGTLDSARVKDAASLDYEFMRTMIERNQAAIAIAHDETSFGGDAEVKRLAGAIASSRKQELEQLRAWLHLWYGGDIQPGPPSPNLGPAPRSPHNGPPLL